MMRILFITQGGHGGSEQSLYNIIRTLNRNEFEIQLVLVSNPDLPGDIKDIVETSLLPSKQSRQKEIIGKILRNVVNLEIDQERLKKIHTSFQPDLWYINTGVLPSIADLAKEVDVKYAVHFHELESVFDDMKDDAMSKMINHAQVNICCSEAVKDMIQLFEPKEVEVFHEHIRTDNIQPNQAHVDKISKELNLNAYKFSWAMAGASSPRKGFDRFIDLAKEIPEHAFVWIGRQRDHGYNQVQLNKIEQWGLSNVKLFDQQGDAYYDYLQAVNGFFLSSREDPFPLVMLEAAFLQKVIVAYRSGGVSEFVDEGMGVVLDAFDASKIAETMRNIAKGNIQSDSGKLKEKAVQFDIHNGIDQWEQMIRSHFNQG